MIIDALNMRMTKRVVMVFTAFTYIIVGKILNGA